MTNIKIYKLRNARFANLQYLVFNYLNVLCHWRIFVYFDNFNQIYHLILKFVILILFYRKKKKNNNNKQSYYNIILYSTEYIPPKAKKNFFLMMEAYIPTKKNLLHKL